MTVATDPRIARMLRKLQRIWDNNPTMRFGQIVWALCPKGSQGDPYHAPDVEWEFKMDRWLAELPDKP